MIQIRSLASLKVHIDLWGAKVGEVMDAINIVAYNYSERNYKMG